MLQPVNKFYTIKRGDSIKFVSEKKPYRVRAADNRFAICTKPFNINHTVLYTIIDFDKNIRGADDRIFSDGYETDEDTAIALQKLQVGEISVSQRNQVPLDIEWIK